MSVSLQHPYIENPTPMVVVSEAGLGEMMRSWGQTLMNEWLSALIKEALPSCGEKDKKSATGRRP